MVLSNLLTPVHDNQHVALLPVLSCRVAGPICAAIGKQGLKQRPGTVKRCTEVCIALIEHEQAEGVVVRPRSALDTADWGMAFIL